MIAEFFKNSDPNPNRKKNRFFLLADNFKNRHIPSVSLFLEKNGDLTVFCLGDVGVKLLFDPASEAAEATPITDDIFNFESVII